MPLSTTSAGRLAASAEASAPSPLYDGANSATWASNSSRWLPPAVSATTRNRSGLARTMSSAWVPIEPVEPSTATSRRVVMTSLSMHGTPRLRAWKHAAPSSVVRLGDSRRAW